MAPTEMEDAHPTFRICFGANSDKPMDLGKKDVSSDKRCLNGCEWQQKTLQIWWFVFNTPIRCMGIWIELKHAQRLLNTCLIASLYT